MEKISILFVCLGNICRSPMAEFIMRDKAKQLNLPIAVASRGTANYHIGKNAHKGTLNICESKGIATTNFKATQLSKNDQIYDLIICMDDQNVEDTIKIIGNSPKIIKATDLISTNLTYIPDPWYDNNFEQTFQLLNDVTSALIQKIKNDF